MTTTCNTIAPHPRPATPPERFTLVLQALPWLVRVSHRPAETVPENGAEILRAAVRGNRAGDGSGDRATPKPTTETSSSDGEDFEDRS
jgi:hypothetical protein